MGVNLKIPLLSVRRFPIFISYATAGFPLQKLIRHISHPLLLSKNSNHPITFLSFFLEYLRITDILGFCFAYTFIFRSILNG